MAKVTTLERSVIGIDLGKRRTEVCVMRGGVVLERFSLAGTQAAFRKAFESRERQPVILEVGTLSPWVSRLLTDLGFEVTVVAATTLKEFFHRGRRKNDRSDAEALAKVATNCPQLLRRVEHRSEEIQRELAWIHHRELLVNSRTMLVNAVRGTLASLGVRLPACSTAAFPKRVASMLEAKDLELVSGLLRQITSLSEEIRRFEQGIETIATRHPATKVLTQVQGVGTLTALTFVLTVTDPKRFPRNKTIGSYLGLVPRQHQSGGCDPQLRITKTGDRRLRCLMVQAAHYILGPFGQDSDLRRAGIAIASRGGKRSKKRAIVAVARRLSVLLMSLWRTGEVYEPLRNERVRTERLTA